MTTNQIGLYSILLPLWIRLLINNHFWKFCIVKMLLICSHLVTLFKTMCIIFDCLLRYREWKMELGKISLKPHTALKQSHSPKSNLFFLSKLFSLSKSCMHNEVCSFVGILPWAPDSCAKELDTYKVHSLSLQQQTLVWDVCGSVPWLSPVQQSPLQPQPRHTMPEWPYICEY